MLINTNQMVYNTLYFMSFNAQIVTPGPIFNTDNPHITTIHAMPWPTHNTKSTAKSIY